MRSFARPMDKKSLAFYFIFWGDYTHPRLVIYLEALSCQTQEIGVVIDF